MSPPGEPRETLVDVEGRTFSLRVSRFENGCFAAVTEGGNRLGSLTVSLYNRSAPVTAEVIPAKSKSLFARLAAERLATRTDGVAILSVSVGGEVTAAAAKEIMTGLDGMV